MGGLGSGNWFRFSRKSTVEESLVVSMRDFRKRLYQGAAGMLTWTWASGNKSSIGYFVTWNQDDPTITLHYRWRDTEDVQIPVPLEITHTQFGGQRWWFTCPLCVRGVACRRRADKLYLPPGGRYFGCRKCHNLTYRSSQEAHQAERLFSRLGHSPDLAKLMATKIGWKG
jgi:hypothetical protein